MSAEVLAFPAVGLSDPRPDPRVDMRAMRCWGRRYRLRDLARTLAMDGLERRTQIARLRQLARLDGLPLPINPRIRGNAVLRGADAICAASLWDAAAIDAWLHRPGPSAPAGGAMPVVPPGHADLHQHLRQRAELIATSGRRA